MKRNILLASFVALALLVAAPSFAHASAGVSVNTGKIVLDSSIMPGAQYDLPNIEVKNIGDEPSDYSMSIEFNEVQSQMKPDASWFHFDPQTFHLAPGESKIVKVSVSVGASAHAGDYFAYVEASSQKLDGTMTAAVSGAAATKLYLSVASSNPLKTGFYSTLTFVRGNAPWTYIVLWVIAILIVWALGRRVHHMTKSTTVGAAPMK